MTLFFCGRLKKKAQGEVQGPPCAIHIHVRAAQDRTHVGLPLSARCAEANAASRMCFSLPLAVLAVFWAVSVSVFIVRA